MIKPFLIFVFFLIFGCGSSDRNSPIFGVSDLRETVNFDSLVFDKNENCYRDKNMDNSGSLYKFNKEGELVFYCFLNDNIYPYAEYYKNGQIIKTEGVPSVQTRFTVTTDSSYRFSFLYSTFRKSDYEIRTITNFNDTLTNTISKADIFSNVGFFNIVIRSLSDAKKTILYNSVAYFDSAYNRKITFRDTIDLGLLLSKE